MKNKVCEHQLIGISLLVFFLASIPLITNGQLPHLKYQPQNAQVFYHPNTSANQLLNIIVIQKDGVTRDTVSSLHNFKLGNGENLAIIERGKELKLLTSGFQVDNKINFVGQTYLLPETYICRLSNGTTVFLEIELICQSNLIIDRSDSRYHGFIAFQLVNTQNTSGSSELLTEPINVSLLSGTLDSFNPNIIQLDSTNTIVQIKCSGRKQLSDSADVNLITLIKQGGYKYFMLIEPFIEMNLTKSHIQGLGIQDAPISILYVGSDKKDSIKVALDVSKGTVIPNTQYIRFNEPAEFRLRSESIGEAEITATSRYDQLKTSIIYKFPWLYLILPILGGVIGALAKTYDKDNEKPIKIGKLLIGGLLGFSGAIAWYALGINLAGVEWKAEFNELAALGIGIVMTLLGVKKSK